MKTFAQFFSESVPERIDEAYKSKLFKRLKGFSAMRMPKQIRVIMSEITDDMIVEMQSEEVGRKEQRELIMWTTSHAETMWNEFNRRNEEFGVPVDKIYAITLGPDTIAGPNHSYKALKERTEKAYVVYGAKEMYEQRRDIKMKREDTRRGATALYSAEQIQELAKANRKRYQGLLLDRKGPEVFNRMLSTVVEASQIVMNRITTHIQQNDIGEYDSVKDPKTGMTVRDVQRQVERAFDTYKNMKVRIKNRLQRIAEYEQAVQRPENAANREAYEREIRSMRESLIEVKRDAMNNLTSLHDQAREWR